MDPTQALADLLAAIRSENRQRAVDAAEALAEWLAAGGFYPRVYEAMDRAGLPVADTMR